MATWGRLSAAASASDHRDVKVMDATGPCNSDPLGQCCERVCGTADPIFIRIAATLAAVLNIDYPKSHQSPLSTSAPKCSPSSRCSCRLLRARCMFTCMRIRSFPDRLQSPVRRRGSKGDLRQFMSAAAQASNYDMPIPGTVERQTRLTRTVCTQRVRVHPIRQRTITRPGLRRASSVCCSPPRAQFCLSHICRCLHRRLRGWVMLPRTSCHRYDL